MKYPIYNQEGKEAGEMTLPKEIFEVPMNVDLVRQVVISQMSNMRQNTAHTKDRSEVRGGGRKPWRQKGTGRARHGSIRSPLWRGGGVAFGPRNEKNYKREIPKKIRKKALCMVLSEKARKSLFVVVDKMEPFELNQEKQGKPKTKLMAELIKNLPVHQGSRLVVYSDGMEKIFLAGRNIKKTKVLKARNVNIVDLLNHKYVLTTKDGIKEIESTFSSKK